MAVSDKQIAKLFARLDEITSDLATLAGVVTELIELKDVMLKVAANSNLVYNEYQRHGSDIADLRTKLTKLNLRCPLLKTDEYEAVKARLVK